MRWLIQHPDGWSPGIGDPTPLGWFTVFAYLVAAGLTTAAYLRARGGGPARVAWVWLAITALMVFLGVNKQLDLQSLFTVVARDIAKAQGWYETRHVYQRLFVRAMIVAGALGLVGALLWLRGQVRRIWLALVGVCTVSAFVVVRAASFHKVDVFLGADGGRFNHLLELGGIALVGLGGLHYLWQTRDAQRGS